MQVGEASDFRYKQYAESERIVKAFAHDILEQCQHRGFSDCEVDRLLFNLGE